MARVLVIDDSPLVRAILCDILRDLGHEAFPAGSADEAITLCTIHAPDIVIKDLLMKGMDLATLIKELRRKKSMLPIVVCSTMTMKHEVCEAIKAGANDFLVKPFSREDVASMMARHLSGTAETPNLG